MKCQTYATEFGQNRSAQPLSAGSGSEQISSLHSPSLVGLDEKRRESIESECDFNMGLWQDFLTNDGKVIHKWVHYFPIYERHFEWYRNKSVTLLEIGVYKGGSLQMWQRYFGPFATIVGIDINEKCKAHEEPGIHVRIGDQKDERFLQSVIDEFGVPDIVVDDGSHKMGDVSSSFQFLYPRMPKNGVYVVEDMHAAYSEEYGGGVDQPMSFINQAKTFIDSLNADHSRGAIPVDFVTRSTFSISFYNSLIVFEKGDVWWKDAPRTGKARLSGVLDAAIESVRNTVGSFVKDRG